MRRLMRFTRGIAALAVSLAASGCTVADVLGSDEILHDLDAIVRIEGSGASRSIAYAERAETSAWYMHFVPLAPVRWPLAFLFGRTREQDLLNPARNVRELLRELPDETGGDLWTCAAAATRFGWIAELDGNPQTRVIAIDGLTRVCRQLDVEPFTGSFEELGTPLEARTLEDTQATIRALDPAVRPAETQLDLEAYEGALATISSRPLAGWDQRLLLVEDLAALLRREDDEAARGWIAASLRRAVGHCVHGVLLRAIQGRSRRLAEVRLCAMEQIRRLGGPRTVPLMLATMAASPAERAEGLSDYDPDPLVRLRLIYYCGQLSGDLAEEVARLPGRRDWEATSPVEFLARTVLNERDYYSKLRTPALVALTWCLRRERLDPDPAWVREWLEGRGAEGRP